MPSCRSAIPPRRTVPDPIRDPATWFLALSLAVGLAACSDRPPPGFQGYVEAEFVNVAAPIAGRLETLAVQRGIQVAAGTPLYALESVSERAAQREAQAQLDAAQARLADLKSGRRAPEQAVTQAQLAQAQTEVRRSATQLERDEAQLRIGGIAQAQLDDVRAAHAVAQARAAQLYSELAVARLASRADQINAQAALVDAARAVVEQANWRLDQKSVRAARAGRVFDTLATEGEWVAAGSPVVRMLPPQNLKVRFFVPETALGGLAVGTRLSLNCDGCGSAIPLTLTYVSTEAEYTPPVIYSNETRAKLVFMLEARPSPADAARLHPGQPVGVVVAR